MNTLVFFRFKANQEYVAQKLCVNRNNPASGCQGKCYLKKEFKKTESKSNQFQSYSKEKAVLFCMEVIQPIKSYFFDVVIHVAAYRFHLLCNIAADVFHPPADL